MEKTIFIESLDSGFVIEVDNKRRAIAYYDDLKKYLEATIVSDTERIGYAGIRNMLIKISVDENLPTVK